MPPFGGVQRLSQRTNTGTTSLTGTFGSTPLAGSLLLQPVAAQNHSASIVPTCTTPSGWTLLSSKTVGNVTVAGAVFLFGKVAAGGDAAPSFTLTNTSTSAVCTEEWVGLINSSIANAQDIVFTPGSGTTSSSFAASAGTTTYDLDWIFALGGGSQSAGTGGAATWGGGFTQDTLFSNQSAQLWGSTATQLVIPKGSKTPSVSYSFNNGGCIAAVAFKVAPIDAAYEQHTTRSGLIVASRY